MAALRESKTNNVERRVQAKATLEPVRVFLYRVDKDMRYCSTCALAPLCPRYRSEKWDDDRWCNVPDKNKAEGVWTEYFSASNVDELDKGLAKVLELQARRVQDMIDEPTDDMEPGRRDKHEKRIDANMDRLYKNGLALRATKVARPLPFRASDRGPALPEQPTSAQIAQAFLELEEMGYNRNAVTHTDVLHHLTATGVIAPQAAIEAY